MKWKRANLAKINRLKATMSQKRVCLKILSNENEYERKCYVIKCERLDKRSQPVSHSSINT